VVTDEQKAELLNAKEALQSEKGKGVEKPEQP
jgi:hypothetical protein